MFLVQLSVTNHYPEWSNIILGSQLLLTRHNFLKPMIHLHNRRRAHDKFLPMKADKVCEVRLVEEIDDELDEVREVDHEEVLRSESLMIDIELDLAAE